MVDISVNGNVIKGVKLFCFDKDGTLIDLYHYWANMVALRAEGICRHYHFDMDLDKKAMMLAMGVDVARQRLLPQGPVGILPRSFVQAAAEEYVVTKNGENAQEVCFRIFKDVDEFSARQLSMFIKPIPGAVALLRQIKGLGGLIAIATTDRTDRAWVAMKFLGVEALIDIVVGADQVKNSKPDPEMLQLISGKTGIALKDIVMVGDAETDVRMGLQAGVKAAIGLYAGITSKEKLLSLTPYVVETVADIRVQGA